MPDSIQPRSLPVMSELDRPFWEGCRQGRLMLQRCEHCQQSQFYPRPFCMHCGSKLLLWVEVSGCGKIYSFTIIRQNKAPEFVSKTPYNVALVELAEGPRLLSHIVSATPEELAVDLAVKVTFETVNAELSLPHFKLV